MQLKLYFNKETLRILRLVQGDFPEYLTLLPVRFLRTVGGCYEIAFIGAEKGIDMFYLKLRQLYEPFMAKMVRNYENVINEVEVVQNSLGETIWYIPSKLFVKYFERFEVCENHLYEKNKNERPEETV